MSFESSLHLHLFALPDTQETLIAFKTTLALSQPSQSIPVQDTDVWCFVGQRGNIRLLASIWLGQTKQLA